MCRLVCGFVCRDCNYGLCVGVVFRGVCWGCVCRGCVCRGFFRG